MARYVIRTNPTKRRRRRRRNPAKFDRCVRDVKRRGGAYNAYAVCNAALSRTRRKRRRNPVRKHTRGPARSRKTGRFIKRRSAPMRRRRRRARR